MLKNGGPTLVSFALVALAGVLAPTIGGLTDSPPYPLIELLALLGVLALCVPAVAKPNASHPNTNVPAYSVLWAVLLGLMCLSLFLGESKYAGLRGILLVTAGLAGFWAAAGLGRDERLRSLLLLAVTATGFIVCLLAIRSFAMDSGGGSAFWQALIHPTDENRLFGPFANPNFFSGFIVLILPVTIAFCLIQRGPWTALAFVAFAAELACLLLTAAKFGIVAGVFGVLVFVGLASFRGGWKTVDRKALATGLVVGLAVVVLFSAPLRTRVGEAQSGGSQAHSTEFRIYTWKATVGMIKANPALGTGPGTFETAYPRYTIAGTTKHAHQSYLQFAAENGVAALILLMAVLILCVVRPAFLPDKQAAVLQPGSAKKGKQPRPDKLAAFTQQVVSPGSWPMVNAGLAGGLAASMARNLVDSDWYIIGIWLPFWVLAGLLVAGKPVSTGKAKPVSVVVWVIMFVVLAGLAGTQYAADYTAPTPEDVAYAYQSGDLSSLVDSYKAAIGLSPWNPAYHRDLGKLLSAQGSAEADAEFARAVALAPKDGENYFARGMAQLRSGRLQEAVESLKMAQRYAPKSTQVVFNLAQAYQKLGVTARYEDTLKDLLATENTPYEQLKGVPEMVDTRYATAHYYFARKAMEANDPREAIDHLQPAISRLERWRSETKYLEIAKATGTLSESEERDRLQLLADCYRLLADAFTRTGEAAQARAAESKARGTEGR